MAMVSLHCFFSFVVENLCATAGCMQTCVVADEKAVCGCQTGFELADDMKSCTGKDIPDLYKIKRHRSG